MTGLRFFTVYGPWGRPDMAYYSFTKKAFAGEPIEVFNNGNLERDFTFVDDIVEGVYRIINLTPPVLAADETYAEAPYRFLNIGNNEPITLDRFIHAIETATDKTIQKVNLPMQPGDAIKTHADITEINSLTGFKPTTSIESGIVKFVEWFKKYHKVS